MEDTSALIAPSQIHTKATCDRQQSTISTSSSVLTNSPSSPSSSLTSISTSSPTTSNSISYSHSLRSVSISLSSTTNNAPTQPLATNTSGLARSEQLKLDANLEQLGTSAQSSGDEPTEFSEQHLRESSKDFREPQILHTSPELAGGLAEDNQQIERDSEALQGDLCARDDMVVGEIPRFGAANVVECNRMERSNSCSQAEASAAQLAAAAVASANAHTAGGLGASSLSHDNLATSVSQQSIPTIIAACLERSSTDQLVRNRDSSTNIDIAQSYNDCPNVVSGSNGNNSSSLQNQALSFASSSSRFFSSKLNTGSLWSLLSVGSNSSTNTNDMTNADNPEQSSPNERTDSCDKVESNGQNKQHLLDHKQQGSIFSRVQFKRVSTQPQQQVQQSMARTSSEANNQSLSDAMNGMRIEQSLGERKRFRFNVKYFGSQMLHKNFTLPMLEWIAKDIRRQTVKGAQILSQRQYTIPARDIFLEIQSYQLTALSCKDGHCIFVHPMHCVSKYAQLQHDPTCFAYLIRETKDSPLFCHVFQAKSANKVHDIFSAVRETTTRSQISHPTLPPTPGSVASLQQTQLDQAVPINQLGTKVQKSASSDMVFGIQSEQRQLAKLATPSSAKSQQASIKSPQMQHPSYREQANNQFENSYQFEVMLVKKVKVQRRRVPASFVDDALETLKSFEVLKGGESKSQIKGVGKRIISASVDERQEYDEACQSPTPKSGQMPPLIQQQIQNLKPTQQLQPSPDLETQRRGSSVSLHKSDETIKEERESRSCQQSPTKVDGISSDNGSTNFSHFDKENPEMKKHQSMDCLQNLTNRYTGETPTYANDFSPYNTITSTDLNERIAAIPVVSSSVSLDHETRQKLARQVRETIMATAANIKKGVYASGDKLNSSASSKALDSLSCTVASEFTSDQEEQDLVDVDEKVSQRQFKVPTSDLTDANWIGTSDNRRSSANPCPSFLPQSSNNFDLFRRASARQVVRNRTVLLLIGKDELCTISIDQHQMLFSKSFSSIVHCLQGNNNKDHFGLICRDSGKINPNAESYAGFIFKCQSEKVVREIMSALKQVIYSSQHNYHGYDSPYNPLNTIATNQYNPQQSPKLERASISDSRVPVSRADSAQSVSLATKRGFTNLIEIDQASTAHVSADISTASHGILYQRTNPSPSSSNTIASTAVPSQPKNLIKSMFCDNCPMYWYHRLCCDIESLPAEASKSIILRRIDSSMTDKEQDELYSKFSEFNIESISEHNEVFMSLLRHLCERKQFKHVQSTLHLTAMAKNTPQTRQPVTSANSISRQSSLQSGPSLLSTLSSSDSSSQPRTMGHQRSGSSSGSLSLVLGQTNASQSISDASSAAIDNFKKAKNSISSSIENMLKRRSSMRDEITDESDLASVDSLSRTGSFRMTTRESRTDEQRKEITSDQSSGILRRSQSTSEYSNHSDGQPAAVAPSWKDSLSRTINDDLTNPFTGFFRRRNSGQAIKPDDLVAVEATLKLDTQLDDAHKSNTPATLQGSPNLSETLHFTYQNHSNKDQADHSSPSSMLSSVFWKKSIFDKIRQPISSEVREDNQHSKASSLSMIDKISSSKSAQSAAKESDIPKKRSREELKLLWRKAIIEQITLIKMDRQNQKLSAAHTVECDIRRVKLNYRDVLYSRDATALWDNLLKQDPTQKVEFAEVARLVKKGVPKQRRGEIWMFLMNQYQLRHGTSFQPADNEFRGDANQTYRDLLSQLSTQQHEIFVDIGRTFPSHPYYSQYLSIGQLSLFNLLKAYSLLDPEVGYCQGLSFVAGILLLHVNSEDEAFELMRHLLFDFGLRKQYLPSMNALHLQLYQLTRLLRDHEFELFNHFDRQDISPSLYAAPWFLTLFASQFPLGFVARLIDLISLIGIEAIFRVSLNLLAFHRATILSCRNLESTMEFMRTDLVKIDDKNLVKIFDKSMSLDLRNKLIEYEIEYTFYCAEDRAKLTNRESRHTSSIRVSSKNSPALPTDGRENTGNTEGTVETTSVVADATATVIIQHLLANNHLKSLRSNYSY